LSSILEALKKAEQTATAGNRKPTPWPAPSSAPATDRRNIRRWLMVSGLVVIAGVLIALFWNSRRPAAPLQASSVETAKPVARKAKPEKRVAQKARATSIRTRLATTPARQAALPVRPARKTSTTAVPQVAPIAKIPPIAHPRTQRKTTKTKTEPSIASIATPGRQPMQSAHPMRNDPRIKLQALVWSPEAAGRFVIINNRLVKEGGSVDNIVVVRINQDDVLLSEGSDQWYEPFEVH
jgi:Type II secretion system protein B